MNNAFEAKTVIIAFLDTGARDEACAAARKLGMEIAGCVSGTNEALAFLMRRECDFVFASIFLPMLPAEGLEEKIFALPLRKRPAVVYFAPENAGKMMLSAYSPTVALPADQESIIQAMDSVYPVPAREEDIKRAEEILSRMGFDDRPARKYLAYASALTANDQSIIRRLKHSVYPAVSKAFGITQTGVADAMRRMIDKAFLSGDIENQYRFFGNTIDETRGKPTVSQLIALVGEMLRTGSR